MHVIGRSGGDYRYPVSVFEDISLTTPPSLVRSSGQHLHHSGLHPNKSPVFFSTVAPHSGTYTPLFLTHNLDLCDRGSQSDQTTLAMDIVIMCPKLLKSWVERHLTLSHKSAKLSKNEAHTGIDVESNFQC